MKRLGDLVESAAAVLLAAMAAIVLIQVIARYVLQWPISWPEEVARYVSVWLTLVGAAAAAAKHKQINVDTITTLSPRRIKRALQGVATVGGIAAVGVLLWAGRPLFGPASRTAWPGSGIEMFWVYLALPVGGVLLLLFLLHDGLRLLRGRPVQEVEDTYEGHSRPPRGGDG